METEPKISVKIKDNTLSKIQVGFLCYDLQPFTEDCLYRISQAISPIILKAYPVFYHPHQEKARIPYYPSFMKGHYFCVNVEGSTPEGLASSINWSAAWSCILENHVVFLFGLQGATAILSVFISKLYRRKLISVNQTLPPEWEKKRRWWVRLLKRWLLRQCSIHVVQTPITKETLGDVYHLDPGTFVEAPFESGALVFREIFDRVSETREELRKRFGWSSTECVFLFVGTLLRFKGIETILEAAAILKKRGANFRVVFIGPEAAQVDEPRTAEYYDIAKRFGSNNNVSFTGSLSLSDLVRVYKGGDTLLLPSMRDMWPKVLVEGALASLPLITTTACGAAGTLVEHGRTGFIVLPNDSEALADAMEKLLEPKLRKEFGSRAQQFVLKFCNPIKEAEGYAEALRRVMELNR